MWESPLTQLEMLLTFMAAFYTDPSDERESPTNKVIHRGIHDLIRDFATAPKDEIKDKLWVYFKSGRARVCEPLTVALCQWIGEPDREVHGKVASLCNQMVEECAADVLATLVLYENQPSK